jgi:hypothetical protein
MRSSGGLWRKKQRTFAFYKSRGILERMTDYQLLSKDFDQWSYVRNIINIQFVVFHVLTFRTIVGADKSFGSICCLCLQDLSVYIEESIGSHSSAN